MGAKPAKLQEKRTEPFCRTLPCGARKKMRKEKNNNGFCGKTCFKLTQI